MWLSNLLWVVFGIVFALTVMEIIKLYCIAITPPYSLENNTIEIPFHKNPDSEVPFFRDCVIFQDKNTGHFRDFHFREVYWLFDSEGNYIPTCQFSNIHRKSCVFDLTPCKLGDVLVRGTLYPDGKKIINFYTLNKVNKFTLSFSKFATLNNPRIVSGELEKFSASFVYLNMALEHIGNCPIPMPFSINPFYKIK